MKIKIQKMVQSESSFIVHLTWSRENLLGILEEGFKIFYCSERIQTSRGDRIVGVPMVSFTEVPISNVQYQLNAYGNYGLVLTREWAKKKKLNPVLYLEPTSTISESFDIMIDHFFPKNKMVRLTEGSDTQKASMDFLRFSKNYSGILVRKGKVEHRDYAFHFEREWRYVVDFHDIDKMFIPYYEYENEEQRKITNTPLINLRLQFKEQDVMNLVVSEKSEIEELKREIDRLKVRENHLQENACNLKNKIITFDQLLSA